MPVPFADLQLQYQSIKAEIDGAIAAVIRDNSFIRGPYVDAFERQAIRANVSTTRRGTSRFITPRSRTRQLRAMTT